MQTVLEKLANESKPIVGEYCSVLSRDVAKSKDKMQKLLSRYLTQYIARNTMDYFIHKDLGGFLRHELDFYLKNEVLKLDDFIGSEDKDVLGGLREAQIKAMQSALEKAQAIRLLAGRLIEFLAQIEDFQKRLWLKKKFVVETHYCITLDRISEEFYPETIANDAQREEWVRLFAIDEIEGDMATVEYSVPLTVEFLKANPSLVLDTAFFSPQFKDSLIAALDAVDGSINGELIYSENFQAIQLLRNRYQRTIDCIYIDPPITPTLAQSFTKTDTRVLLGRH